MTSYADYISSLHEGADAVYAVAEEARSKGFDPKKSVEIPKANDLADRTQKLLDFLHPRNTAEQIRELTKEYDGNRERVAIEIAKIVCAESYLYGVLQDCSDCGGSGETKKGSWKSECFTCTGSGKKMGFKDEIAQFDYTQTLSDFEECKKSPLWKVGGDSQFLSELAIYHGICAGLAVLTEGILVAPLEGVVSARFVPNQDGTHSLAISYASAPVWSPIVLSVLGLTAIIGFFLFILFEKSAASPLLPYELVNNRFFIAALACAMLSFLILFTVLILFTPYFWKKN